RIADRDHDRLHALASTLAPLPCGLILEHMGFPAAALGLALLQAPAAASPVPAATDSTRTVDFWVMGEKGEPVEGLGEQEVVVLENGSARAVSRLVRDTRPLTVAIVVDSSGPQASAYRLHLVDAVATLVRRLPEGARYALWTTGDRPRKVLDLTDNRGAAAGALRKVFPAGGNTLFDALTEAAEELQEREAERTAIVAITGIGIGFSNRGRQAVVDELKRRRVPVLAVQFDERGSAEFEAAGADQVARFDYDYVLGNVTRGVYERSLSSMAVGTSLGKVAAALSGSYRATYITPESGKPGKIEVQVARPGVKVQVGDSR
ncbi:MAG TPA: VWA domain-containing protein, partial [Vicinamibacteria bacterium]|nr:VWA domain-containing protein [Vicinamibacteria bacterium]